MTVTAGYSNAVGWLQQISGVDPQASYADKGAKDPVLVDLHDMKDAETSARALPPPRRSARLSGRNAHNGVPLMQQQPKPKFVAHKAPTKAKKVKGKVSSNRLGGEHMA